MIFKKHLRGQKITAGLCLFLHMGNIFTKVFRLRMAFRITRTAYTKITLTLDLFHQFTGIMVIQMCRIHPLDQVTAKCQNIVNSEFLDFFDLRSHKLLCRSHTGQMCQCRNIICCFYLCGKPRCKKARSSTGSVSHTEKIRFQCTYLHHSSTHRFVAFARFWRKYLKGQCRILFIHQLADLHLSSPHFLSVSSFRCSLSWSFSHHMEVHGLQM